MAKVETVAIERNGAKVLINKSAYDPGKHKLHGEKSEAKKPTRRSTKSEKSEAE